MRLDYSEPELHLGQVTNRPAVQVVVQGRVGRFGGSQMHTSGTGLDRKRRLLRQPCGYVQPGRIILPAGLGLELLLAPAFALQILRDNPLGPGIGGLPVQLSGEPIGMHLPAGFLPSLG